MVTNFDIFRWKDAGISNLGINKLLRFYKENPTKISLRQIGKIAGIKSIADFIEKYKNQDIEILRKAYRQFQSFSILDDIYPERLKEIYNPPTLIFYQGNLELLKNQKIGFVGSREASQYAKGSVEKIIADLGQIFTIVSGLARGVDTISHISAIKSGLPTIAIIGTGLDVFYPLENRKLQEYIGENHLLLTEYVAGEKPLKFHFPERNRIIAGLSRGVIVAEAKIRSGSLITCERAMEEGRDVFAIPGNITDGYSDGCHHLIQQGAKLIFKSQDILEEYIGL